MRNVMLLWCCTAVSVAVGQVSGGFPHIVNGISDETSAVFSADGSVLFLSRAGHPQNIGADNLEDIWASCLSDDGVWSDPKLLHFNTMLAERPAGVSADGQRIWLTWQDSAGSAWHLGHRSLTDSMRSEPVETTLGGYFKPNASTRYSVHFNEDILLLSHASASNPNMRDLFVCRRNAAGMWGFPLSLSGLNSPKLDESAPFLSGDGLHLYYVVRTGDSSDIEIKHSVRLDESWQRWSPARTVAVVQSTESEIQIAATASCFSLLVATDGDLWEVALSSFDQPNAVCLVRGSVKKPSTMMSPRVYCRIGNIEQVVYPDSDGAFARLCAFGSDIALYTDAPEGFFSTGERLLLKEPSLLTFDYLPGAPRQFSKPPITLKPKPLASSAAAAPKDELADLRAQYAGTTTGNKSRKMATGGIKRRETMPVTEDTRDLQAAYLALYPKSETPPPPPIQPSGPNEKLQREYLKQFSKPAPIVAAESAPPTAIVEAPKTAEWVAHVSTFRALWTDEVIQILVPQLDTPAATLLRALQTMQLHTAYPTAGQNSVSDTIVPIAVRDSFKAAIQNELIQALNTDLADLYEHQHSGKSNYKYTRGLLTYEVAPMLMPLQHQQPIPLFNIVFEANQTAFVPDESPDIERLWLLLRRYPTLSIEIGGHTDISTPTALADRLTQARAQAVADALIAKGIASHRLQAVGYGKKQPLDRTNGPRNRRIEVKIIQP